MAKVASPSKKAIEVDDADDPIGWNSGTAYGTTREDWEPHLVSALVSRTTDTFLAARGRGL